MRIANKCNNFTTAYEQRLRHTQIECNDAVNIINVRDSIDTFFYLDPPYMEAHQGHYNGYKAADFELLLQVLSRIKGKFLLSNYPSGLLNKYIIQNHWYSNEYARSIRISASQMKTKKKIEVLTANYKI